MKEYRTCIVRIKTNAFCIRGPLGIGSLMEVLIELFLERNIVMSDGVSIQKMRRATTAEKKEIFEKFASIEEDGMKFMTPKDFLVDYVGLPVECEGTGL